MNCIFCPTEIDMGSTPAEHIIPNNIGGTVVTYEVCETCNHIFSAFDVELHRHRHVYDSYKTVKPKNELKLEFRFIKSFVEHPEGGQIKFIPKNTSNAIVTSKLKDGLLVYDCSSNERDDVYLQIVKNIQEKYGISQTCIDNHLKRYNDFKRASVPGSVYRDDVLTSKVEIHIESTTARQQTIMNAKTPHRFIAKACVEFASLLGISDRIANIRDMAIHARDGGLEDNRLKFFVDETSKGDGVPFHFILFTESQFIISFFGKWGTAVEISWRDTPMLFYLANDILEKRLIECKYSDGEIETTTTELCFPKHIEMGRPTHSKR